MWPLSRFSVYHNTTFNSSKRLEIDNGLKKFLHLFGHSPRVMANHSDNKENIYWGSDRLSGLRKIIYNIITRFKKNNYYKGHDNSSLYFWGDLCQKNITYVRNFVFVPEGWSWQYFEHNGLELGDGVLEENQGVSEGKEAP